jgi:3-oxoacyl-[acyl-carrier protein] reductase
MDLKIKNKTALITGASAGLGFAAAKTLAEEGVKIAINSRSMENLQKAASEIEKQTGISPVCVDGDISEEGIAEKIVERAVKELGPVDILVSNCGGPPAGMFMEHDKQTWKKSVDLTLLSAINLSRAVLPTMVEKKWGRIIFITSISVKQPIDNLIISNSLRAGVTGFAKSISNEYASHGITVNTVCPGYTETERLQSLAQHQSQAKNIKPEEVYAGWTQSVPAGRLGQPDELAALITFLASDRAAYITGTSLPVDGGYAKGLL